MKKNKRLGALTNLLESKEKDALLSLVEARNKKMIGERKLEQLQAFQDQYLECSQSGEQAGISISRMLETRNFMDQIAKVIQEQEHQICSIENQIRHRNDDWVQSRHHRSGFEKLIQKERHNQIRAQDKREQAEIDDRSGQSQDGFNGTGHA